MWVQGDGESEGDGEIGRTEGGGAIKEDEAGAGCRVVEQRG